MSNDPWGTRRDRGSWGADGMKRKVEGEEAFEREAEKRRAVSYESSTEHRVWSNTHSRLKIVPDTPIQPSYRVEWWYLGGQLFFARLSHKQASAWQHISPEQTQPTRTGPQDKNELRTRLGPGLVILVNSWLTSGHALTQLYFRYGKQKQTILEFYFTGIVHVELHLYPCGQGFRTLIFTYVH